MSSSNNAASLSNVLKANWNVHGLDATNDVFWSHTRYEALNSLPQGAQKVILSVYNPPNPSKVQQESRECYLVRETVLVDVLLLQKSYANVDACLADREAIRSYILAAVAVNQFRFPNANNVVESDELVKAESPEILRFSVKVTFLSLKNYAVPLP